MSRSAIAGSIWRPLRGIDAHRLRDARQQVHQAVQWLARAARAYLQPRADDGHTSLGWDDSLNGFVTHPMPGGMQLCLCVPSLTLTWGDRKDVVPLSLGGHTDGRVRQWIGEQVAKQGLDANALDAPAPYTLTLNATYDAMALSGALAELAVWFANADVSLGRLRAHLEDRRLDVSEVRCWPHHFDLATLISFPARGGETGYVGAGLSPGDGYYDEPYFYISAHPRPDPATLPKLPALGHWHTHEFTAAVAPAHKILARENREAATDDFLKEAVDYGIKVLK